MEFFRGDRIPSKRLRRMVSEDRHLHGTRGIKPGSIPGDLGVPSGHPTSQNRDLLASIPQPANSKPRSDRDVRYGIG